jgi:RNA polymerase sigma factor (sigma-70 family)
MSESGSSAPIDPLLVPFLYAVDEEEEQRQLQQLLSQVAELVERVTTDEDEYQTAIEQLITALRRCKADPERNPIHDFRRYSATAAKRVRMRHRRAERPEYTALKDELRRCLRAFPKFALWQAESGEQLCGWAEWAGQSSLPTRSGRLADLRHKALDHEDELLSGRAALHLTSEELIAAICRWLDHPLKLDDLTEIIFDLKRIVAFVEVSDPNTDDEEDPPFIARAVSRDPLPDEEAAYRELLQRLWAEIEKLPPNQRIASLLNFTFADGQLEVFVFHGVASIRRIGNSLELSAEHFARLWSAMLAGETMPAGREERFAVLWEYLPLDDSTIARVLDTTRQNVINLRSSARKRLERRLAHLW